MRSVPLKAVFHTLSLSHRSPGLISSAEQPQEGREAQGAEQGLGVPAALDTHTGHVGSGMLQQAALSGLK